MSVHAHRCPLGAEYSNEDPGVLVIGPIEIDWFASVLDVRRAIAGCVEAFDALKYHRQMASSEVLAAANGEIEIWWWESVKRKEATPTADGWRYTGPRYLQHGPGVRRLH